MTPGAHVAADLLDQVDRAGDVGVDDMADLREVLVEEGAAEPVAGVGEKRLDGPSADGGIEAVHTLQGREVGLHRLHPGAQGAKVPRGIVDFRLVGGDDEIEAVLGADTGEFVADAGGGAGNDGERTGVVEPWAYLRVCEA